MKIEMAESLLASWCRHVKQCQIVQTNWKASRTWELNNLETLEMLMRLSNELFSNKYGYNVYRASGMSQLIQQAEIDVMGLRLDGSSTQLYAIDVAFHESGLLYGDKQETTERIIKKCLRTAMCIYGFYGLTSGDIIFASPKIHASMKPAIDQSVDEMLLILQQVGLGYGVRVIANEEFSEHILQPVVSLLPSIADTGELFVRSLQMYNMFANERSNRSPIRSLTNGRSMPDLEKVAGNVLEGLEEMKIGQIAKNILRNLLEDGKAPLQEVRLMQTLEYSKKTFDIQFPLLQSTRNEFDHRRYYVDSLTIYGERYFLCSQWLENDRPYLLKWLSTHQ